MFVEVETKDSKKNIITEYILFNYNLGKIENGRRQQKIRGKLSFQMVKEKIKTKI